MRPIAHRCDGWAVLLAQRTALAGGQKEYAIEHQAMHAFGSRAREFDSEGRCREFGDDIDVLHLQCVEQIEQHELVVGDFRVCHGVGVT